MIFLALPFDITACFRGNQHSPEWSETTSFNNEQMKKHRTRVNHVTVSPFNMCKYICFELLSHVVSSTDKCFHFQASQSERLTAHVGTSASKLPDTIWQ